MSIPKLHYISQGLSAKEHLDHIQKACSSGAELVQLRLKAGSEKKQLKIAFEAREITSHFQTRLIINDAYQIAKEVKADGVHLGPSDASPALVRPKLKTWQWIGGTANTLQDCEKLVAAKVDYISLGPFQFTETKANLPHLLGLEGYNAILDLLETDIPVLAVGGITLDNVTALLATGIYGIAVSGAITKDFNAIKTFNHLLNAPSTSEQRHSFE